MIDSCIRNSILVLLTIVECTHSLRAVRVDVPYAVRNGEKATLKCLYDLQDDSLYSVKWYKGRREFYRYSPKENPPMKIFPCPGIKIERFVSNESHVVLSPVILASSGKYSCEVSADAPSFHTLIGTAELEIVEIPQNIPSISGIREGYRTGDILRGNCTSKHSKPAAHLTWTVNNKEVNAVFVRHYKIWRDSQNEMETSIIGINFLLNKKNFNNGKLKLRCVASISDVYYKSVEKTIIDLDHYHRYISNFNTKPQEEYQDQYTLPEWDPLPKRTNLLTRIQDFVINMSQRGKENIDVDKNIQSKASLVSALLWQYYVPLQFASYSFIYLMKNALDTLYSPKH